MSIRHIHIFWTIAALLLSAAVSSCSQDEIDVPGGDMFAPDKYPLLLRAYVGQMPSRADAGETVPWGKGDIIRVRIYNPPTITNYPALGQYMLNPDGSVNQAIDPIAWPDTVGIVKAWYPFFEIDKTIEKTITDQSKGYHDIDFLYAETHGKKHFKETVDLLFKHKMAKVRCVLKKGEGITEEDFKTITLTCHGLTSVSFSEDAFTSSGDGWITPYSYSDEDFNSVFEALLPPYGQVG